MCDVPQVVAEAAADRKRQKLRPIKSETAAARAAFGSINDSGMGPRPTERCFCTCDIAQLDRDRWHGQRPSRFHSCAATQITSDRSLSLLLTLGAGGKRDPNSRLLLECRRVPISERTQQPEQIRRVVMLMA